MERDIESCIECYEGPESRSPDEKSKGLNIIDDFNEMYNEQLKKAQDASDGTLQLQIKTLQHWVFDLSQQNKMLVKTVEELEEEALKRIDSPYPGTKESRRSFPQFAKMSAPRAVPESGNKPLPLPTSDEMNNETLRSELEETKKQLNLKTKTEGKHLKEIEELRHSMEKERKNKTVSEPKMVVNRSSMTDLDCEISTFHYELEATKLKLAESEREITHLRTKLTDTESNIRSIRSDLLNTEKNARDMRAALTAEVAEKHDQILALKREVSHLEDQLRQADMQTHFKDDIIKKLREDVKVARSKLKFLLLEPDESISLPPNPKPSEMTKLDIYQKSCHDDVKILYPDNIQLSRKSFANQPLSDSFKSLQNQFVTIDPEKTRNRKSRTKSSTQSSTNSVENRCHKAKGKLTFAAPTANKHKDEPDIFGKGEPTVLAKVDERKCPVHGDVPAWANTYLNHAYHEHEAIVHENTEHI